MAVDLFRKAGFFSTDEVAAATVVAAELANELTIVELFLLFPIARSTNFFLTQPLSLLASPVDADAFTRLILRSVSSSGTTLAGRLVGDALGGIAVTGVGADASVIVKVEALRLREKWDEMDSELFDKHQWYGPFRMK